MNLTFALKENLNAKEKKSIDQGFTLLAQKAFGKPLTVKPWTITAYDGATFVGAINGQIIFGGLNIDELYIQESYRTQGIGKKLLFVALDYGIKNNCRFAWLVTCSFHNAVNFYKKYGFAIEFSRSGYDHDIVMHYMTKKL